MIKRIQLRGISRTPSDRMTEDGGCAESINIQTEASELAPMPKGRDVTEDIFGNEQNRMLRYVHKLPNGSEIYVASTWFFGPGNSIYAFKDGSAVTIASAPSLDDAPKDFVSIGNILVVYTATTSYYFQYNDGEYKYLGTEIPRPKVEIISWGEDEVLFPRTIETSASFVVPNDIGPHEASIDNNTAEYYNDAKTDPDSKDKLNENINAIWDKAALCIEELRMNGKFVAPFFLRYALRLYDGSYIYTSEPVLCGAGKSDDWFQVYIFRGSRNYDLLFNNIFEVRIKGVYDVAGWSDMVQSIDFFASEPIYTPAQNAVFGEAEDVEKDFRGVTDSYVHIMFAGMTDADKEKTVKDAVLSKSQYNLVASVSINDGAAMSEMSSGGWTLQNSEEVSGASLFTKKDLPYSYRDGVHYLPLNGVKSYNSRILLEGASESIPHGPMFLNGLYGDEDTTAAGGYTFRYKIIDASGQAAYVVSRDRGNSYVLSAGYFSTFSLADKPGRQYFNGEPTPTPPDPQVEPLKSYAAPYSWLFYPDSRCVQVEVYHAEGSTVYGKVIPMAAHPGLEGAYAFFGLGVSLKDILTTSAGDAYEDVTPGESTYVETPVLSAPNKLLLSEFQNPFLVKAGGIITFGDEVIGTAMTSVPLSEGQYGQFPLYVFTGGGIRTLGLNSEGGISVNAAEQNLARLVALKGTILGMEQAVVFSTDKGVMLLSGGTVQCISDVMNGEHHTLDEGTQSSEVSTLLTNSPWASFSTAFNDTDTFMQFIKNARPIYDYNGSRIIFIGTKKYWYVYYLRSMTWHKLFPGGDYYNTFNSFPECLVQIETGGGGSVVKDFSTPLGSADLLAESYADFGMIATRPIDLGEPDVRKCISNMRVRGKYKRSGHTSAGVLVPSVRYLLLGSLDGLSWKVLPTLRGGSYKWFKIVLLTYLAPTERISWIDVDYETRFTNRLR